MRDGILCFDPQARFYYPTLSMSAEWDTGSGCRFAGTIHGGECVVGKYSV
jgi:hypothetical protein